MQLGPVDVTSRLLEKAWEEEERLSFLKLGAQFYGLVDPKRLQDLGMPPAFALRRNKQLGHPVLLELQRILLPDSRVSGCPGLRGSKGQSQFFVDATSMTWRCSDARSGVQPPRWARRRGRRLELFTWTSWVIGGGVRV